MQAAETPRAGASQPDSPSRLIAVLAAGGFASTFAGRVVEPLVGVLARDLASPPATVALLSTAFALPYALIQPVLGPVGDALGKERVVVACLFVLTLALGACIVAGDIGTLFGLRMLAGAAAGGDPALARHDGRPHPDRAAPGGDRPLPRRGDPRPALRLDHRRADRGRDRLARGVRPRRRGRGPGSSRRRPRLRPAPARPRAAGSPSPRPCRATGHPAQSPRPGAVRRRLRRGDRGVRHLPAPRPPDRGPRRGRPKEAGLVLAGFAAGGLAYSLTVGLLLRFLGQTGC